MTIQEMARKGGQASVKKRLGGKTQSEISEMMRLVRMSNPNKKESKKLERAVDGMVKNLNNNIRKGVNNV